MRKVMFLKCRPGPLLCPADRNLTQFQLKSNHPHYVVMFYWLRPLVLFLVGKTIQPRVKGWHSAYSNCIKYSPW